jgi:hypothetical protein
MRLLQVTLGALEELHTQLQLSFVEGEKEVRLQLAERMIYCSLFDVHTISCHGRWEYFRRKFCAL